ncbi:MAG: helicase-exonuclease AddAB subunit AddA [Lachnospiraceae bacterium]|jgi:ATP-dependent helicase/nuclease subunit A|nr:helicase-exonuclease AddAB subunit AddA [Lachnospiraceae bacterium]
MEMTEDQKKIRDLRGVDILASAAAGSGKTTTLVERIIREIEDPNAHMSIDRMLIVTFTNAAARDMKSKINQAIHEALAHDPADRRLKKQLSYIANADIMTIDAFCKKVITMFYHEADIDPSFAIMDEYDQSRLKNEAIDEYFEDLYSEGISQEEISDLNLCPFTEVRDILSGYKNDDAMKDVIFHLYSEAVKHPMPYGWLDSLSSLYDTDHAGSAFYRVINDGSAALKKRIDQMRSDSEAALNFLDTADEAVYPSKDNRISFFTSLSDDLSLLADRIIEYKGSADPDTLVQTYYSIKNALDHISYLGDQYKSKSRKDDQQISDKVKEYRDKIIPSATSDSAAVKGIRYIYNNYFMFGPDEIKGYCRYITTVINTLVYLTKGFMKVFEAKKKEKNVMDFDEVEQTALSILTVNDGGILSPSSAAIELGEFYQEIMIDEYQDSNLLQEAILTAIAGHSSDGRIHRPGSFPHLFMVGDVKQSIYGFRHARPDLFVRKYNDFRGLKAGEDLKNASGQIKVDLNANFRSNSEVIDSVNEIFDDFMTPDFGGVDYKKSGRLIHGLPDTETTSDLRTELMLITGAETASDQLQAEAKATAKKIKEIAGNMEISVIGGKRKVRFSDICILMRSTKDEVPVYKRVFENAGIPLFTESRTGYFERPEVAVILACLTILDDPLNDIPLVTVLRSELVGLTDKELADIKIYGRGDFFYERILSILGDYKDTDASLIGSFDRLKLVSKLRDFYNRYNYYRHFAEYHTVNDLINAIYKENDYYDRMRIREKGRSAQANLDLLLKKAQDYNSRGITTLYDFVSYISDIIRSDNEEGEAGFISENEDAVRIMTIHHSKGLEFPVVFVSRLCKDFNKKDARGNIIYDSDLGAAFKYMDRNFNVTTDWMINSLIKLRKVRSTMAEELRILYVALTRARQKIYLTASFASDEKLEDRYKKAFQIYFYKAPEKAAGFIDWILAAFYDHPSLKKAVPGMQEDDPEGAYADTDDIMSYRLVYDDGMIRDPLEAEEEAENDSDTEKNGEEETYGCKADDHPDDDKLAAEVKTQLEMLKSYEYPYDTGYDYPSKIGVTSIDAYIESRERGTGTPAEETDLTVSDVPTEEIPWAASDVPTEEIPWAASDIPAEYNAGGGSPGSGIFDSTLSAEEIEDSTLSAEEIEDSSALSAEWGLSGTDYGTLIHSFFSWLPFEKLYEDFDPALFIDGLYEKGMINSEAYRLKANFISYIEKFKESELTKTLSEAAKNGLLYREQPFMILYDGRKLFNGDPSAAIRVPESASEEKDILLNTTLVQGTIDLFAVTPDGIILIDYKTNSMKGMTHDEFTDHLKDIYHTQIEIYKKSLTSLTGLPVIKSYLYSLAAGEYIAM